MSVSMDRARADRLFDISGRVFVVTGAASGLGASIAEVLLANGARVLLLDRDGAGLASMAAAFSENVSAKEVDVAEGVSVRTAVDAFVEEAGRVDGLFANAGVSGGPGYGTGDGSSTGRLEEQDAEHWNRILRINLLGVLNSMQAVVPYMKRARAGSIVVTASVAGMQAEPFVSYAYAAAKAATVQTVRQAALELAPFGVSVNGIAPGFIRTGIAGGRLHDPEVASLLAARIPLGRLGAPQEIQGVSLLLASEAGRYLTGAIVPIDGGVLLGRPVDQADPGQLVEH